MSYRTLFRFSYIAGKQFIGHNSSKISIVQKNISPMALKFLVTIFQKFVIIYFCRDLNLITSITIVVVGNKYNSICQKNICQNPNQTTKYLMLLCGLLC